MFVGVSFRRNEVENWGNRPVIYDLKLAEKHLQFLEKSRKGRGLGKKEKGFWAESLIFIPLDLRIKMLQFST